MKNPHTFVRLLLISDDLTPQQIEGAIGLKTTDHWIRGETRPPKRIPDSENRCVIHSGATKTTEVEQHLEALLATVYPHAYSIKEFSRRHFVQIAIAIYFEPDCGGPPLNFSQKIMQQIADLGAGLDIDLYRFIPE